MLEERRRQIMAELHAHGSASLATLARLLNVSQMTVRRDLDALADAGRLTRIRGGAMLDQTTPPPTRQPLSSRPSPAKAAVALLAAEQVLPATVIGLSAGTTTALVAHHLRERENLTVVTNSLPISDTLTESDPGSDLPHQSVVLTGGIRTATDALVGPVAVRALDSLHCDICIVSGTGLTLETGVTSANLLEAETNRAFVETARRTIVVVDHTKWDRISLRTAVELNSIDTLIIDGDAPEDAIAALRDRVPQVLVAPVDHS